MYIIGEVIYPEDIDGAKDVENTGEDVLVFTGKYRDFQNLNVLFLLILSIFLLKRFLQKRITLIHQSIFI